MTKEQIYKTLKLALIVTLILLVFEIIFSIDAVTDFFKGWITNSSGWVVYLALWIAMFLQCIIPIPAVAIITASIGVGIIDTSAKLGMFALGSTWVYIAVVLSAYMVGAVVMYILGRKFGKYAVKWVAGNEEDYNKWRTIFNKPLGKWIYTATVFLPLFADDLNIIIVASLKMNFWFFFWVNLVGRFVGLVCMLGTLALIGAGGNGYLALIGWSLAVIAEIIGLIIIKMRMK